MTGDRAVGVEARWVRRVARAVRADSLGVRLTLAFLAASVGAVALLGGTILVTGRQRITALIASDGGNLVRPGQLERDIQGTLVGIVALGVVLAVLVAIAVSAFVAARVLEPVVALTQAARALRTGEPAARAGLPTAVGELGELVHAFDEMVDALQRQERLRQQLVADVAHELRTPVSILQGQVEALLDGVTAPTPDSLGSLHDEVLRLGRLIADLDVLAAADAAALQLRRRPVDLATIARETVERVRPQARAEGLDLQADLVPAWVHGDPARLGQILVNLLSNALKFTPAGGAVSVRVRPAGTDCRLVVADSGPGLRSEEIRHAFDRFWRGERARTVSGTGLGLAIVAELVRGHGGTVAIDSPPGGGTAVTVGLPAAAIPAPPRVHSGAIGP